MVGMTVTTSRLKQQISMSQRSLKKQVIKSAGAIAKDGERLMKLMVPRDTSALEDAVVGWVDNDKSGDLVINVHVSDTARNEKTGAKVADYASYMNDGFTTRNGVLHRPYKLGKNSLAKVPEARPYKVGMNFTRRASRQIQKIYRAELLKATSRAGMKARWSA